VDGTDADADELFEALLPISSSTVTLYLFGPSLPMTSIVNVLGFVSLESCIPLETMLLDAGFAAAAFADAGAGTGAFTNAFADAGAGTGAFTNAFAAAGFAAAGAGTGAFTNAFAAAGFAFAAGAGTGAFTNAFAFAAAFSAAFAFAAAFNNAFCDARNFAAFAGFSSFDIPQKTLPYPHKKDTSKCSST
jgi:hypothetical protein